MRNNEGEWFKALLATGGCSSLLTLFLLLLPHSFWVCLVFLNPNVFFYLSPLVFWLMSLVMKANAALSCLAFWYDMLCFALCCFSFIFCCLFCYSPVRFSLYLKMWILLIWMEKLNCKTFKWCFTERNPIGPLDPLWNQNLSIHSVHSGFLDLGLRSPIWPVHEPEGIKTNKMFIIRIMDRSSGSQPF